eukprot:2954329-Pleurochrysis_carterae.AAC.5
MVKSALPVVEDDTNRSDSRNGGAHADARGVARISTDWGEVTQHGSRARSCAGERDAAGAELRRSLDWPSKAHRQVRLVWSLHASARGCRPRKCVCERRPVFVWACAHLHARGGVELEHGQRSRHGLDPHVPAGDLPQRLRTKGAVR